MTAEYEWIDETGLRHPSIVFLDITSVDDDLSLPIEFLLEEATVLEVRRIDSFQYMLNANGWLDMRKVRMKGYEFRWHCQVMDDEYCALFVALVKKEDE